MTYSSGNCHDRWDVWLTQGGVSAMAVSVNSRGRGLLNVTSHVQILRTACSETLLMIYGD